MQSKRDIKQLITEEYHITLFWIGQFYTTGTKLTHLAYYDRNPAGTPEMILW